MTGVGLSLGDGGKDNNDYLRVVGVVLGSPAQVGGIKQVVIKELYLCGSKEILLLSLILRVNFSDAHPLLCYVLG